MYDFRTSACKLRKVFQASAAGMPRSPTSRQIDSDGYRMWLSSSFTACLQQIQLAEARDNEPISGPPPPVHGLLDGVQHRADNLCVLHVHVQVHPGLQESLVPEHLLQRGHGVVLEPLARLAEGQILDPLACILKSNLVLASAK